MIKKNKIVGSIITLILILLCAQFVFAGVGIKWNQESALVNEGEKTCLIYSVYNPWPENTYVSIEPSDELKTMLTLQDVESKLVPANTASTQAIPIQFCFKIPNIYSKDCWVGNFLCKQECKEEQKLYDGSVNVKSVPPGAQMSGTGGSATTMSVSAPLKIKVRCVAYGRDFTLAYIIIAIISAIAVIILLIRKYRKPKAERDREKLRKLQETVRRESRNKRNK